MDTLYNLLLEYVIHLHELYYVLADVYARALAWCSWIDFGCLVAENLCRVSCPQDVGITCCISAAVSTYIIYPDI